MIRKALVLGGLALVLGTTACSKDSTTSTSATTAAGASSSTTAAPASSTTAKDKTTTTTADDEETTTTAKGSKSSTTKKAPTKTPVTKPAKNEKVDPAKLPPSASTAAKEFDLGEDETDCINTVVFEYVSDETNATDDATMSGVLGGAIAVCVDPQKIATAIVASVKQSAPNLTATQASCLEGEIAGAPTDDLALFLGSFIYEGEGADELQAPFIEALGKACNLG